MWLPPWIQWSTLEPVIELPPTPVPEVMPNLKPPEEIAPAPDAYSEPTPEIELEQTLPAPTIETVACTTLEIVPHHPVPTLAMQQEFVPAIESILHQDYFDTYFPKVDPTPRIQAFVTKIGASRDVAPDTCTILVIRGDFLGLHHQLIESHHFCLQLRTSRRGSFYQRRLMGTGFGTQLNI